MITLTVAKTDQSTHFPEQCGIDEAEEEDLVMPLPSLIHCLSTSHVFEQNCSMCNKYKSTIWRLSSPAAAQECNLGAQLLHAVMYLHPCSLQVPAGVKAETQKAQTPCRYNCFIGLLST